MVTGQSRAVFGTDRVLRKSGKRWSYLDAAYLLILAVSLTAQTALAQSTRSLTLAWDPNTEPDLVGYRLYYGEQSRNYSSVVYVPVITQVTIPSFIIGNTYYFAVTAVNRAGLESDFSDEVVFPVFMPNTPPAILGLGDFVIEQDDSITVPFRVLDGQTPAAELTLRAFSTDPEILPLSNVIFNGTGEHRTLTMTPIPGHVGDVGIEVSVTDGEGVETLTAFRLMVAPLNSPPTLDPIADRVVDEDWGVQAIRLTGISAGGPGESQAVRFYAYSSDRDVIPDPNIIHENPNNLGFLFFRPKPDASGTTIITVLVDDGQLINNLTIRDFRITVLPANDWPVINPIPTLTIPEDAIGSIPLSIRDLESSLDQLRITATCTDAALIPPAGLQILGSGSSRSLVVRPATNQFGTAAITITATDPQGAATSSSFAVNVMPVNDPPTLNPLPDISLLANANPFPVVLSGISAGPPNEPQAVSVSAFSSNPSILPHPSVTYAQGAPSGVITLTPAPNAPGDVTVTVRVTELATGISFSRMFIVSIFDVTDLLTSVPNEVTISEIPEPISFVAYSSPNEPESLVLRASCSDPLLIPPNQIQIYGQGPERNLLIIPTPGKTGIAMIGLTAECGGLVVTKYIRVCVGPELALAAYDPDSHD
jgi:hypothetical protein